MAENADVLELLRSRLADMEARQRSSGGTSASDFWARFAGVCRLASRRPTRRPGPGWQEEGPPGGARSHGRCRVGTGHGRRSRSRRLESLDLRRCCRSTRPAGTRWSTTLQWIEATAERAARRDEDCGNSDRQDAIAVDAVAGLPLHTHADADLTAAAERVAHQRRNHEVTLVNIVSELVSRGIDAPGGLSRVDWLRSHDASLTAGQAKAFVTVGTALADARWARLRLLVATQQVTVGNAAQIVDFHGAHGAGRRPRRPRDRPGRPHRAGPSAPARGAVPTRPAPHRADQAAPRRGRARPGSSRRRADCGSPSPTPPAWSACAACSTRRALPCSRPRSTHCRSRAPRRTSRAAPSRPITARLRDGGWTRCWRRPARRRLG